MVRCGLICLSKTSFQSSLWKTWGDAPAGKVLANEFAMCRSEDLELNPQIRHCWVQWYVF